MPTFQRVPKAVEQLAQAILRKHESHKPLLDNDVKIDLIFAFSDKDDKTGDPTNDAITHNGYKALGLARKLPLKDRVMGRGDGEILLDGDWWNGEANEKEQEALLDHELHHLSLKAKKGYVVRDDIGRPLLELRKHDVHLGWFHVIAKRNPVYSQECQQAKSLMDEYGQLYWAGIAPTVEISTPDGRTTGPISAGRFNRIAKEMAASPAA